MNYLIADTHFSHRNIIRFEGEARPFATIEEHDAELVARWNATVTKQDTVWHLGDVLFGSAAFAILPQLNGTKKLVLGNHDRYPIARYLQHFTRVAGVAELGGCILSHVPVHPSQFPRFRANIHGHLHSRSLDDPRYINVSVERIGLRPVALDELLSRLPPRTATSVLEGK
jgi:calcineurin-like phosphoesterase family protein